MLDWLRDLEVDWATGLMGLALMIALSAAATGLAKLVSRPGCKRTCWHGLPTVPRASSVAGWTLPAQAVPGPFAGHAAFDVSSV